jgi:hypothetical protein
VELSPLGVAEFSQLAGTRKKLLLCRLTCFWDCQALLTGELVTIETRLFEACSFGRARRGQRSQRLWVRPTFELANLAHRRLHSFPYCSSASPPSFAFRRTTTYYMCIHLPNLFGPGRKGVRL